MNYEVYYFSGTGNTLAVGREIATRLNAKLIPIPRVMKTDKIYVDAQSIGIVFPSYLAVVVGMPLIIERFVEKIANINTLHIFAVCTCGGYECVNALPSLNKLNHLLKTFGGKLSSEYSVRLPMNNLDYNHIPIPIEKDSNVVIKRSKNKIDSICDCIIKKSGPRHKLLKVMFLFIMKPFFNLMKKPVMNDLKEKAKMPMDSELEYSELIPLTDRSIIIDEKCTGCGTCAKVCPVNNIKLVNRKPLFQHNCEMCFACDEWCPSEAIHHWGRAKGIKYRHPEVMISDIINNSEGC